MKRLGLVPASFLMVSLCGGCASLRPPLPPPDGGVTWTGEVPRCPCRQPPVDRVGDGWAVDRPSSLTRHPGASVCFRSYPPVRTAEGLSGQQCCYDTLGTLIIAGPGAGTPDRASSCGGELRDGVMKVRLAGFLAHVVKDVRPWSRNMTWRRIHRAWPPDNRNRCEEPVVAALGGPPAPGETGGTAGGAP